MTSPYLLQPLRSYDQAVLDIARSRYRAHPKSMRLDFEHYIKAVTPAELQKYLDFGTLKEEQLS